MKTAILGHKRTLKDTLRTTRAKRAEHAADLVFDRFLKQSEKLTLNKILPMEVGVLKANYSLIGTLLDTRKTVNTPDITPEVVLVDLSHAI